MPCDGAHCKFYDVPPGLFVIFTGWNFLLRQDELFAVVIVNPSSPDNLLPPYPMRLRALSRSDWSGVFLVCTSYCADVF